MGHVDSFQRSRHLLLWYFLSAPSNQLLSLTMKYSNRSRFINLQMSISAMPYSMTVFMLYPMFSLVVILKKSWYSSLWSLWLKTVCYLFNEAPVSFKVSYATCCLCMSNRLIQPKHQVFELYASMLSLSFHLNLAPLLMLLPTLSDLLCFAESTTSQIYMSSLSPLRIEPPMQLL